MDSHVHGTADDALIRGRLNRDASWGDRSVTHDEETPVPRAAAGEGSLTLALRGSIAVFILALVAGAAVTGWAVRFHDAAARDHERQKARLGAVLSQYRTIDAQRRLIEVRLPEFRELEEAGVIGEERRLAWIETLREAAARVNLPSLRYRFERRTAHPAEFEFEAGAYRPFATVVHLETGLLHEGDLVALIRALEDTGTGLHRIDRCELSRAAPEFVMRPGAVNLTAKCQMRWITLARVEVPA